MLKNYQDEAIKRLDTFCNDINSKSITKSFKSVTGKQYLEIEEYDKPYVCVRIPTGGGKTLIASKSIRVLVNEYLNNDYHLVFWLAPSDKIVTQTLDALKDKRHFYRQVLDKEFDNVKVMSVKESYKETFNPKEELVIIVGTIQSFRTNSKDGRKFYEENGSYHELLKDRDVIPSMENVMKFFKPIIILDEAHRSSTTLSLQSLLNLNPSFIFELTATPITKTEKAKGIYASNILYSVSATELKKEDMIKLPIFLKTLDDSMSILKDAIEKRNYLEELAKLEELHTNRYIRPINLIRADENRGEDSLTYDKIKTILMEDFNIDESHIAIHTGNKKELDGIDLLSGDCNIRYIITVDALKEGWDCPFAYVLSVVSNMESKTAIEQLIGRVLRMPYIEQKDQKELAYSYVLVASSSFEEVADSIGQTLVNNGFEQMEAKISINQSSNTNSEVDEIGGLWGEMLYEDRQIKLDDNFKVEDANLKNVEPYINTETKKLSIVTVPTKSKREKFKADLKKVLPVESHTQIDEILAKIESLSDDRLEMVSDIELPKLMIEDDGEVVEFEESLILEYIDITDKDLIKEANLSLTEFDIELNEHDGIIDVVNNKLIKKEITAQQTEIDYDNDNKKIESILNEHTIDSDNKELIAKLVISISKIIVDENKDILKILDSKQLKIFISLTIINLLDSRENIDIYLLKSKKYQLKRAILNKLKDIIINSKEVSFNSLFATNKFRFDANSSFVFSPTGSYNPNPDNRSGNFNKHKYEGIHKLDTDEEYEVAMYIDKMDSVSSWIRNIDKDPLNSFWLQTKEGKFYPDFIIHFKSGITAVAEYKGKVYIKEYEETKKPVGDAWGSLDENYKFLSLYATNFKDVLNELKS